MPLKRYEALAPLSREHHFGLLLSWKIKKGLSKEIEVERIAAYCRSFYQERLEPHFRMEERLVFPLLAEHRDLQERAILQHREIESLLKGVPDKARLFDLAKKVEAHIRFEERVLFEILQSIRSEAELNESLSALDHDKPSDILWEDAFWLE